MHTERAGGGGVSGAFGATLLPSYTYRAGGYPGTRVLCEESTRKRSESLTSEKKKVASPASASFSRIFALALHADSVDVSFSRAVLCSSTYQSARLRPGTGKPETPR